MKNKTEILNKIDEFHSKLVDERTANGRDIIKTKIYALKWVLSN